MPLSVFELLLAAGRLQRAGVKPTNSAIANALGLGQDLISKRHDAALDLGLVEPWGYKVELRLTEHGAHLLRQIKAGYAEVIFGPTTRVSSKSNLPKVKYRKLRQPAYKRAYRELRDAGRSGRIREDQPAPSA